MAGSARTEPGDAPSVVVLTRSLFLLLCAPPPTLRSIFRAARTKRGVISYARSLLNDRRVARRKKIIKNVRSSIIAAWKGLWRTPQPRPQPPCSQHLRPWSTVAPWISFFAGQPRPLFHATARESIALDRGLGNDPPRTVYLTVFSPHVRWNAVRKLLSACRNRFSFFSYDWGILETVSAIA